MIERPDLSKLSVQQKDDLIVELFDVVDRLYSQVVYLQAEVKRLEAQLNKTSRNSSKPPSSDGLSKKPGPQSLRKKSGAKPGGQIGHEGHSLKQVCDPDWIQTHELPSHCDGCGQPLERQQARVLERRQVLDLPQLKLQVTEHRTLGLQCRCGRHHESQFPAQLNQAAQYGPRMKAAMAYLTQYQLLPMQRASRLLGDLCGAKVSAGTIYASCEKLVPRLEPVVQAIGQALSQAPVVHFDESGLRVQAKLHWLHTACTEQLTWYGCHPNRGTMAMDAFGILAPFQGVAVHDGWAAYRSYEHCQHGLCNAHHLRELIGVAEQTGQVWPDAISDLLLTAKQELDQAPGQALSADRIEHYHEHYRVLLQAAFELNPEQRRRTGQRGRIKQTDAFNLLQRLDTYRHDVLRFIAEPGVPFSNNLAEQAIRMIKVKQKISGCFRTMSGAQLFCTIRSYLETMRKQGKDLFECLVLAFQGQPPQPSL